MMNEAEIPSGIYSFSDLSRFAKSNFPSFKSNDAFRVFGEQVGNRLGEFLILNSDGLTENRNMISDIMKSLTNAERLCVVFNYDISICRVMFVSDIELAIRLVLTGVVRPYVEFKEWLADPEKVEW